MMELPKPDIIFTHESDLDGLVAGLMLQKLAKHLYQRDVPLEAHHYNYWKQRELREKAAWVTDFTYARSGQGLSTWRSSWTATRGPSWAGTPPPSRTPRWSPRR